MWIINDILSCYFGLLISVSILVVSINGNHHDKQMLLISPSSTEVVHFVNDSHIVSCSVNKGSKIKWVNPKGNIITDTKGRVHVEDRSLTTIETRALVFEHISVADKGNWTCVVDDNLTSKSFRMVVNEPISFMDTPTVQSAREANDATIRCEVKGDPEPVVSWYFNGVAIILPNDKFTKLADGLLVKRVSRNDSGEYLCKAFQVSTTISNVEEQTIRLNVQHKPIPVKRPVETTFAYPNGVLNLTCDAIAEPPANFTWYRLGKKMSAKSHVFYNSQHSSFLQVFINSTKDYGDYKCKAQNIFGQIERVITIKVGVKPDPPTTFHLRGVNFDTFDIDVGAAKAPESPTNTDIIGYRFEYIPKDELERTKSWSTAKRKDFSVDDGVTYLITQLLHDTVYAVRVASRNAAGLSNWTETKIFTTHPLQPHGISSMGCALDYSNILLIFSLFILIHLKE